MERLANGTGAVGRNAGIDLLRGLSILLVVLHHIGLRIRLRKTVLADVLPEKLLSALNFNGYEAVFIFFVISGFLITSNALRRSGALADIDLRAFYARRFSRIGPCLLLLVAVLSILHILGVQDYVVQREGQTLPRAILSALSFHLNWYEGMTGYLPGGWDVLWSLSIEEVFYLGFPVASLLTRRTWVLAPMLIVLAVSLPWTRAALADNEIWQEKAYLPGMAAIATGVLGALLVQHWQSVPRGMASALGIVGSVGLYLVMFEGKLLWSVMHDGYMLLLTGSALCLVLASAWAPAGRTPWRGLEWLRSWGRLSYEIYLTHMFVVTAVVRLYKAAGSDIANGYLWYLPALPLCWVLGKAVERYISTPVENWLRERMLPKHEAAPALAEAASL
jgi:peptidoglycan/LPS O-acetylase OafA/YrhL